MKRILHVLTAINSIKVHQAFKTSGLFHWQVASNLCDFAKTVKAAEPGPTPVSLLQLISSVTIKYDGPKLVLDSDDEPSDYVESALSFYKGPRFSADSSIHIHIRGEAAVDGGGEKRQFSPLCYITWLVVILMVCLTL